MSQENSLIASDLPKGTALVQDLNCALTSVSKTVQTLIEKIIDQQFSSPNGLTILDMKNVCFADYLTNLSYPTLLKISGQKLEGHQCIENLTELRVVLERIKPLENKAKFQINKYLTESSNITNEKNINSTGTSNNKISIDDIGDSSEEDVAEDEEETRGRKNVYRPPRISQVHYPDEDKEKEDSQKERQRSRLLNSDMMRDALQEFTEDPEVVIGSNTNMKTKVAEKHREIERYEEDTFTRISLSKKDKRSMRNIATPGNLAQELLSFRSLEQSSGKGNKRKKTVNSNVNKGKKKRKFK